MAPSEVEPPMKLLVSGLVSGIGKSSVSLALLMALVDRGRFQPSELAYIKPATQCEGVQLVAKYCHRHNITCEPMGPVVYRHGFTYAAIDGTGPSVSQLHQSIVEAVARVSSGKKLVLIDGVGYAAVGSVSETSNAHIARLLNVPVLFVGPAGVGNAIDSVNMALAFFEKFEVRVLGAVFNKLDPSESARHTIDRCKHYVGMYFAQHLPQQHIYGFLPRRPELIPNVASPSACLLTYSEENVALDSQDLAKLDAIRTYLVPLLDDSQLLEDVALSQA